MPDVRDEIVDLVKKWSERAEMASGKLIDWIGISRGKYSAWSQRYGSVNLHNGRIPRDFYLAEWERQAIIDFYKAHTDEGYRRITFMMMDSDIVAVSPATTYRVLKQAGLMESWARKPSKKGKGFSQPTSPHQHWHVDVAYINVCGTFFFLCSILDGYSRYIVHWDLREQMTERDIEIIVQRARELFPHAHPRIISDNGPQFIANDFKEFIRLMSMTHVRTSPFYPQSNGKIERYHRSIKSECIRVGTPLSLQDAKGLISSYVFHYNTARLHSAIGYIAPKDMLEGRAGIIFAERDRKLELARDRRKSKIASSSSVSIDGGLL